MKKLVIGLVAALALSGACGRKEADGRLTIAMIPKGTTHNFWQSIHAGGKRPPRSWAST